MSKIPALALLLFSLIAGSAYAEECSEHFNGGLAPRVTNSRYAERTHDLCFEQYAVLTSDITMSPLWSAEYLTTNRIKEAKKLKRFDSFHEEERLPLSSRAYLKDFRGSGMDRGHMAPNSDFSTYTAQTESFSLANIIAQDSDNNQYLWGGIETATRTLATRRGRLYVVTGPIFDGTPQKLKHHVSIPTRIYKAVYDPVRKEGGAYIATNAPGMDYQTVSIAELETITGINLYPSLSQEIKNKKMELPQPTPHGDRNQARVAHARSSAEPAANDAYHIVKMAKSLSRFFR